MDIKKLMTHFDRLGIRKGENILVHSSLRSMGNIEGGAETVIMALKEIIGKDGTLLMPTLSYQSVTKDDPLFQVNDTPSCVGALTEVFRKMNGTIRSLHPTHSIAAYGKNAPLFIKDHEQDNTPVGPNSPLSKLRDAKGKILFLGCRLRPNTSMHGVEEFIRPNYLFNGEVEFIVENKQGVKKLYMHTTHNFEGWEQRYDRIENILDDSELIRGKVLEADCFLMNTKALWKKALSKLKEDPLYFVDKK